MNRFIFSAAILGVFVFSSSVLAQLPTNPWAESSELYETDTAQNNTNETNETYQSASVSGNEPQGYADTPSYDDILPVDPWARARVNNGDPTWRGSGRNDRGLNYVGEATTYGDNYGQEMIAPEVNRHNMLVMTQHLRNMGYKIPKSYDQKIREMPQTYARYLRNAYDKSMGQSTLENDPLGALFSGMISNVEEGTGLDFENLLFNSIDILSKD